MAKYSHNTAKDKIDLLEAGSTAEHSVTSSYPPLAQMWMHDPTRATYVTTYRNDTGLEIPPEAFDTLKWTRISSAYHEVYGLEHTQTGMITGDIAKGTGTNDLDIAEGTGVIIDMVDPTAPTTTRVFWAAQTLIVPSNPQEINWVTVDNLGVVSLTNSKPALSFYNTNILLGAVSTTSASIIHNITFHPITTNSLAGSVLGLQKHYTEPNFVSGGVLRGIDATMQLELDAGIVYGYNINFKNSPTNPHEFTTSAHSPVTFTYIDQNNTEISTGNTLDPDTWDNAGVQDTLTTGKAQIQMVYYNWVTNAGYIVQGQIEYKDYQDALNLRFDYLNTYTKPSIVDIATVFLGHIIVEEGTTDIVSDTAHVFTAGGENSGSSGGAVVGLNDLSDVTITTPLDSEVLTYNLSTTQWESKMPPGLLTVTDVAHGHSVLGPVRITTGGWERGKADTTTNLPDALVIDVIDADNFVVATAGIHTVTAHGKTVASDYYTSDTVSGTTTTTIPTTVGNYVHLAYTVFDVNTISIGPMIAQEL